MAEQRLSVFPSRMNLTMLKERVAAAKTGHDLLKRKSDAIKVQLNKMLRDILTLKRRVGESLKDAFFSHTEAQWAAGNFNNNVIEHVENATYRVKSKINNVAGVKLPVFDRNLHASHGVKTDTIGLSKGGNIVNKSREIWTHALEDLVQLASLQTSVKTLDDALKVTNRRVNALEFVIMPMLYNTIKYIISELDELEREDQYRIKKVKDLRSTEDETEAAELAASRQRTETQAQKQKSREDELWEGVDRDYKMPAREATEEEKQEAKSMLETKQFAVDTLLD